MGSDITKVGQRRLRKLEAFLGTVPAERFDMYSWVTGLGPDYVGTGDIVKRMEPKTCGFAACAVGWAASEPSLRKAGLRLTISLLGWIPGPEYKGLSGWQAVRKFFGMSGMGSDAEWLFASDRYSCGSRNITPDMVRARINALLAEQVGAPA
jgi:hypothetical protein